ncbi:MAG TPA: YdbH domain-containing protein, partial [Alphaproteobacteria bacterium]|nr:YdbH domain-containing protein [Alphaproteobacteria bacterium]
TTELGRATVSLATSMRWGADGEASGEAALDALVQPTSGPSARMTATLPTWRSALRDRQLVVEIAGAELALPAHGVALTGVAVTGSAAPDLASATLQAELRDRSTPAGWRPLKIALDGRRAGGELTFSGRAQSSDRALTVTIRGSHNLAAQRGAVTIEVAPVRFKPGERQPSDLLAALAGGPREVGGAVSARSVLSWHGRAFTQSHIAVLDDVSFESGIAQVSALNGRLTFDSLVPLRTPAPQRLRASVQIASLPPGPFDLLFSLSAGNRLRINEASYAIAGGTLVLAGAAIESGRPFDAALEIRAVDLGALLRLIGVDGLSGSGALDGRIPVHVAANGVAIHDGRLAAKGRGIVRYSGAGLQGAIAATDAAAGDTLKLLQDALADFHYTELTMTLDRSATGDGSLLVHLKGANPAVLDGHPFNLNIRLETNFDRLATIFIDGYAAATELLKGAAGR